MNVEVKCIALAWETKRPFCLSAIITKELRTALFRERRQATPRTYQYEPNNEMFNFIVLHSCIMLLNKSKMHVGMCRNYRARYAGALLLTCQLN